MIVKELIETFLKLLICDCFFTIHFTVKSKQNSTIFILAVTIISYTIDTVLPTTF